MYVCLYLFSDVKGAMTHYENSETGVSEIPRMLFSLEKMEVFYYVNIFIIYIYKL